MILKELFDKEFLYEESKKDIKANKIFYKFDIKIKKKKEEELPQNDQTNQQNNQPPEQQQDQNGQPVDLSMDQGAAPIDQNAAPMDQSMAPAEPQPQMDVPPMPTASVVTEDDDKVEINDDENIVRKLQGEIVIPKEDVDNIQTVEDLITKLTEEKVEGVNILDEFTADIIQTLANPATQTQISTMIDKESSIFVEIIYGKKLDNSVGLRIIKRKNSDMVTTTMLLDNKIINAPYRKETIDERIVNIRNDEYGEA